MSYDIIYPSSIFKDIALFLMKKWKFTGWATHLSPQKQY